MQEPLFFNSQMQSKIWGGTKLRDVFGYTIPSDKTGEYWAISAHPNGVSLVANGQFAGLGLDELYQQEPQLFGFPKTPVFPLLTKILDANDWLSVQVHPDDAYAMVHEGELGKNECWYVLEADEGAEIIYGHTAQDKAELAQLIAQGEWERLLTRVPVKAGDFFDVPSGTMHAIGKGVMILETQQSSDTTYRVYDFDRRDESGQLRDLHLNQSIDVLELGQPKRQEPVSIALPQAVITLLVSNDFFTVCHWKVTGILTLQRTAPYLLVSVISGQGQLHCGGEHYTLAKGSHFILPYTIEEWSFDGEMELIISHVSQEKEN